jgi:XRE family aerobic/anaerobic benzoate catabolism transcriptional regulator
MRQNSGLDQVAETGLGGMAESRAPLLVSIGERVKTLRARRGMPRRALSQAAKVSERHLANLETGIGNVSVLILQQVAQALDCPIAELVGDETTSGPEWLMIRQLLHERSEHDLQRARIAISDLFATTAPAEQRRARIAFVGLRGAGKSTLGRLIAEALNRPFIELSQRISNLAGCSPAEIQALYGPTAYRRYEAQALQETIDMEGACVLATPGGLVSDPASFNLLLSRCYTVWLRARAEEHMNRVIEQGDLRPMAGNKEAMEDLKAILAGRTPFYAKADLMFDTSGKSIEESLSGLLPLLQVIGR